MFGKSKNEDIVQADAQQIDATQAVPKPKEKKKKSNAFKAFLIGFILGGAAIVGVQFSGALTAIGLMNAVTPNETKVVNTQMLVNELKNVEELASLSFKYTNYTEASESNDLAGIKLPFTSNEFVLVYQGEIKLGVDMSQADVKLLGTKATITLPKPKVLSDEIDEESVKYYDLKNDIFNQIQWEDRQAARKELKKQTRESELMQENLVKAGDNAKESVKAFCEAFLPEGYTVEVLIAE